MDEVVQGVEPGVDDGVAEHFEAADVQRDVVIDEEDRSGAVALRIADVGDDAVKEYVWKLRPRISMMEQKLQSYVQPREVSTTSARRPRIV